MAGREGFRRAWDRTAKPPCKSVASHCDWYARCASESLACEAFHEFVRTGRGAHLRHHVPSHWRYVEIMGEDVE
jgi:hypothetical protein